MTKAWRELQRRIRRWLQRRGLRTVYGCSQEIANGPNGPDRDGNYIAYLS